MNTKKKMTRRSFLKKTGGGLLAAGLATPLTELLSFGKEEIVVRAAMELSLIHISEPTRPY